MPISLSIKEAKERIISAINDSKLPACVVELILHDIYLQIKQAAKAETEQAEKQLAESEGQNG